MFSDISGGQLNPAVSFGLFFGRVLSLYRAVIFSVVQIIGGIIGGGEDTIYCTLICARVEHVVRTWCTCQVYMMTPWLIVCLMCVTLLFQNILKQQSNVLCMTAMHTTCTDDVQIMHLYNVHYTMFYTMHRVLWT